MAGRKPNGFTLLEMMIGLAVLLVVGGVVMSAMLQMVNTQGTIQNRTEMHSSVRNATELLSQEIGQAGRISLPIPGTPVTLTAAVTTTGSQTVGVSSAAGMFTGEYLVIDAGASQETIQLTGADLAGNTITGIFNNTHASGGPVAVQGAFATGIVPPAAGGYTNGSTDTVLKLYGDINGDGNMVYIEYTCDTNGGYLYRNVVSSPLTAASKPAVTQGMVLLNNVQPNPGGAACFTYQTQTVPPDTYVVDVAVTLTVQTQTVDPQTGAYQTETKALLNIAPRNVFQAWELASVNATNRIQPIPANIKNTLLP